MTRCSPFTPDSIQQRDSGIKRMLVLVNRSNNPGIYDFQDFLYMRTITADKGQDIPRFLWVNLHNPLK